ncbi:MAG: nucleotide exchange factor GrpE [Ferruginibacter sp.]
MEEKETVLREHNMDINADADVPGNTHMDDTVESEAGEKLQAELEEQKDKYLRLFAEFENFKRRTRQEKDEFAKIANRDIVTALLEVLDDCDRAEKQMQSSEDVKQIKEGVTLVFNKLRAKLQSKGVKAMESIHTDFDVEKHEAIAELPAGEDKAGKVVDEAEKGYYLHDKIIRFAKVVVGK